MAETPLCPQCGRPLQRDRDICIYCGRELTDEEMKQRDAVLTGDVVGQRLAEAEAELGVGGKSWFSPTGKIVAKVVITVLSLLAVLFISWLAEWNPFFIGLSVVFFSLPIWQVFRKL